ncbi:hypothetical protein [Nonomuraea rubra]|uniref:hypothetical protein n=1 Tax=Nonomuraea rubra TaxID=46180 RepID=UPI0031ECFA9E
MTRAAARAGGGCWASAGRSGWWRPHGLSTSAALARRPPVTGAELRSAVPLPPPYQVPAADPAHAGAGRFRAVRDRPAGGDRGDPARRQDAAVDVRGHLPRADDRVAPGAARSP